MRLNQIGFLDFSQSLSDPRKKSKKNKRYRTEPTDLKFSSPAVSRSRRRCSKQRKKREVGEDRNTNTTKAPFVENLISAKITTPIPFFKLFQTKSTRSAMKRRSRRDHHRAAGEEFSEHRRHCRCSPTNLAEEPKP